MAYPFIKTLEFFTKAFGLWFFKVISWFIATGFFLFFPKRVAIGIRFYRNLFPEKKTISHIICTWRQYHNFTGVFLDRFVLLQSGNVTHDSIGMEYLEKASQQKRGGIILMSHLGNWEIAANLLQGTGIRLLLYMGIKLKEKIEKMQKESLSEQGIKIVAVEQDKESPFDVIEGINFIKGGGFVSLTGDRTWREGQRVIPVSFLGHTVNLPEAPYLFALLTGAPLFIFFVFKTGKKHYEISASEPIYVKAESRSKRGEALAKAAQQYADLLEESVKNHPLEWYHFEEFLNPNNS